MKYDTNKYIHVVLFHDDLATFTEQGFSTPLTYQGPVAANLDEYMKTVARTTRARSDCRSGFTLVVFGGLGRGLFMPFTRWNVPDWELSVVSLPDLLMIGGENSDAPKLYLKCVAQKAWVTNQGVRLIVPNGDFNLYSFWRKTNYQLIPRDLAVAETSMLSLGPEFVATTRQEARTLVDLHATTTPAGAWATVMRFGLDAYFTSMRRRPIYGSLTHVRAGILAGVVETDRGATWLTAQTPDAGDRARKLAYELWSGLLGLFDVLVSETEASLPLKQTGALDIVLDFRNVSVPDNDELANLPSESSESELTVSADRRTATIHLPAGLLSDFRQPENIGENSIVRTMTRALVGLHGAQAPIESPVVDSVTKKVLGTDVRLLHLFATRDIAEYLSGRAREGRDTLSLAHEDFAFATLKLTDGCTRTPPGDSIRSKEECNALLHNVVLKVWRALRDRIRQFDRTQVLKRTLAIHEAIIADRAHWQRTAKAVIALHAAAEDVFAVARKREGDRNNLALAARTLMEIAVCESPRTGGRPLSEWECDELLAKAALLIEAATDSDAIYSDLVEPVIKIWANGEYTLDRPFYEQVIQPFQTEYFREGFQEAATRYETLYRDQSAQQRPRLDELFSSAFVDSFHAEFGLTPDEAVEAVGGLVEIAAERDSVVVETTVGEIRRHILRQGSSLEASAAFLKAFALFHRAEWDQVPPGFTRKDISPWRYGRRLSAVVRPLLAFGSSDDDPVLYGLETLRQGVAYLLDRTERGQMPNEFFVTDTMKAYLGAINHERGHRFAESVADMYRIQGWQARTLVQMTELGAPVEYGDIDVLAWVPERRVELIECKRLQLARTVAEIAEICRRFRGEAKDELAKHIRRVNWVKANASGLSRIAGFNVESDEVDGRVVTNTHVPMRYLQNLPISADRIGPVNDAI